MNAQVLTFFQISMSQAFCRKTGNGRPEMNVEKNGNEMEDLNNELTSCCYRNKKVFRFHINVLFCK